METPGATRIGPHHFSAPSLEKESRHDSTRETGRAKEVSESATARGLRGLSSDPRAESRLGSDWRSYPPAGVLCNSRVFRLTTISSMASASCFPVSPAPSTSLFSANRLCSMLS